MLNNWDQLSSHSSEDDVTSKGLTDVDQTDLTPKTLKTGVFVAEFLGEAEKTGRTPTAQPTGSLAINVKDIEEEEEQRVPRFGGIAVDDVDDGESHKLTTSSESNSQSSKSSNSDSEQPTEDKIDSREDEDAGPKSQTHKARKTVHFDVTIN